jgi:phosphopantetheinyl transferase
MKKMDLTVAQHFFTKLWVLKESYIKMDGRGFLLDTKNILFEMYESNTPCLINNSLKKVKIRLLNPVPDLYLAIMENKTL